MCACEPCVGFAGSPVGEGSAPRWRFGGGVECAGGKSARWVEPSRHGARNFLTGLQILGAFAAGFVGGLMNGIAGGGTLATFPSLLALGLDAKIANATSTVALWPASLAGAWGHRAHLDGTRAALWRLGLPSVAGGAVGAALLLFTPTPVFVRLVPWLILFATALFAGQEGVVRFLRTGREVGHPAMEPSTAWWSGAMAFQFLVGVYGGYFGAGAGILMLAALGLLGFADIHRANGVKNILGLCVNAMAVLVFVACGLVSWPHVASVALGGVVGASVSALVARRLGRRFVRGVVVAIGIVLTGALLWKGGL